MVLMKRHNEREKLLQQLEDARAMKIINWITACLGRKEELPIGEIFPLLSHLSPADDDIDPRDSFEQAKQLMRLVGG